MTASTDFVFSPAPQDFLRWIPAPLATGNWVMNVNDELVDVADISLTVTLGDGVRTTVHLDQEDGLWSMPR